MKEIRFNSDKPYAILIGLDTMHGLQYSRILHSYRIPVIGIADNPEDHSCLTNTCDKIIICETDKQDVLNLLEEMGPKFKLKPVIITCIEKNVLNLAKNKERLKNYYHIKLPSLEVIELMVDKMKFTKFAQNEQFPVPETYFLNNRNDAIDACNKISYPCLLKPNSRTKAWTARTTLKAFKIHNQDEFLSCFDEYFSYSDGMILQEWIEGPDSNHYTCNLYFNENSEPLVTFVSRKLRQWPPKTGQGCFSIEARNDVVLEESIKLFKRVNFVGLCYLDMKLNDLTGRYLIVEPNVGRPTGRAPLAEAAGVEYIMTMYCDCTGLPLPENRLQKYGKIKWIHLRRDIQAFFIYHKNEKLTFWQWLQSLKGKKAFAVFSWKDPLPFGGDIFRVFKQFCFDKKKKYSLTLF